MNSSGILDTFSTFWLRTAGTTFPAIVPFFCAGCICATEVSAGVGARQPCDSFVALEVVVVEVGAERLTETSIRLVVWARESRETSRRRGANAIRK
jgi:hypothetical protein